MTPTERAQAYHAALWQAQILLDDGNAAEAKRVIEAVLDRPDLRANSARFSIATAAGAYSAERWRYRAEQASEHFIIHQRKPGPEGERGPFAVTHDPSGMAVAHYASRGEARNCVRAIENLRLDAWSASTPAELIEALLPQHRRSIAALVEAARIHPSPLDGARLVA